MKLKRLEAPKFWRVPKKVKKWVVSPRPGPHRKFESIPLQIIVRDILKLVDTGKEAKRIINQGEVLVDGKPRKDHAYPAGLFDVITFPRLKQSYRIIPAVSGLTLIKIPEKEANMKICKVNDKTIIKKGKLQLNLHDGKNILVDNFDYKTGDSVLIDSSNMKILEHIPLIKGNTGIVAKGKNSGKIGKVKEIVVTRTKEPAKVICEIGDKTAEVLKEQFMVIGKDKPLITVE